MTLSSDAFGDTLDQLVDHAWAASVASHAASPHPHPDFLEACRLEYAEQREAARREGITWMRAQGAAVPADFGLPCRTLVIAEPEGRA